MASRTVMGDENLLSTINEKFVTFEELKVQGWDLQGFVSSKMWDKYFDMLCGPIYLILVKEV